MANGPEDVVIVRVFMLLPLIDTYWNKSVGDFPTETVSFVSLIVNDFASNYTVFLWVLMLIRVPFFENNIVMYDGNNEER